MSEEERSTENILNLLSRVTKSAEKHDKLTELGRECIKYLHRAKDEECELRRNIDQKLAHNEEIDKELASFGY